MNSKSQPPIKCISLPVDLDEVTFRFYAKIADHAGLPLQQVIGDVLFHRASELSARAAAHCGRN